MVRRDARRNRRYYGGGPAIPTLNLTVGGTVTAAVSEGAITAGGKTITLTLTLDTWVAAGATFNAQRQAIIDGLDSAQAEANGWNVRVRDALAVTDVARTSDTVATIILPAFALYDITADDIITPVAPAAALATTASNLTSTNAFTVAPDAATIALSLFANYRRRR